MGLLELNGLSPELLTELSYASQLGRSLKNNLDSFEKEALLQDALAAAEWLDINPLLAEVAIDYRIKSEESIRSKYERCYPHRPVIKTFNDILGFVPAATITAKRSHSRCRNSRSLICRTEKRWTTDTAAYTFTTSRTIFIIPSSCNSTLYTTAS